MGEAVIALSAVIGALTFAFDLTEGQPFGHSLRTCAIGMRLATERGLGPADRSALFYALLLKDAGCSSNSAKVAALFAADDQEVKRDRKLVYWPGPVVGLGHVARTVAPGAPRAARFRHAARVVRSGADGARELTRLRCERGADIARLLGLPEATARAILHLDEHWDGRGYPRGLRGQEIGLLGRIVGLAQTADVFLVHYNRLAAYETVRRRRGHWFDPELVDLFEGFRDDDAFWDGLTAGDLRDEIAALEPFERAMVADERRLEGVARAFARVVDAKSPYTTRHSEAVAEVAEGIGGTLGFGPGHLRDLRWMGLLHDLGKLGVSNRILDKPGRLTEAEWAAMRRHTEYTRAILERTPVLGRLADVASAHHERLDGSGYDRGLPAERIGSYVRIVAVADVFEALSGERPYRAALARTEALAIMRADVPHKLCPLAFSGLEAWLAAGGGPTPLHPTPLELSPDPVGLTPDGATAWSSPPPSS